MNASTKYEPNLLRSVYIEPAESPVDYHREALKYWERKRGTRFAPSWRDISLMDFPPKVIPAIVVTDINHETFEMSYRFWGSQLTEMHGHDYTGETPADLMPKLLAEGSVNAYQVLIEKKIPQLEIKEFYHREVLRGRQMVLRLPLSNDGENVSNSMNITYQELAGVIRPHSEFFNFVLSSE